MKRSEMLLAQIGIMLISLFFIIWGIFIMIYDFGEFLFWIILSITGIFGMLYAIMKLIDIWDDFKDSSISQSVLNGNYSNN